MFELSERPPLGKDVPLQEPRRNMRKAKEQAKEQITSSVKKQRETQQTTICQYKTQRWGQKETERSV